MTRRRAFVRDSAHLAGGQIVLLGSAAIVSMLAARWLGPAGKGELALAVAVGALLGPVAAGGIDTFLATRWGSIPDDQRSAVRRLAIRAGWLGGLAIALVTAAFGALNGLAATLIGSAALAAALRPPVAVGQAIRISEDRVAELGRVAVAMAAAQLAVLAPFAFAGVTAAHFALSAAASLAVGLLLLRAFHRARPPRPTAPVPPVTDEIRRDIRRFGGATVLADGLQLANYRIDLFILAAFVPVPAIGVYSVAVLLAEVLWQVPNAIARSLLARMSNGDVSRRHVLSIAVRLGAGTAALAAAGLALSAALIPTVLGRSYSEVAGVLAILLPGVVILGAAKPLAAWTLSCGYPGRNLRASALGFGVAVASDLVLIPWIGIKGAALASTLSYVVTAIAVVKLLPDERASASAGGSPIETASAAFPVAGGSTGPS